MSGHLDNAAAVLAGLLARRQPEHTFTVEVTDGDHVGGQVATRDGEPLRVAEGQHPDPVGELGAGAPSAGTADDDGGQEAA